MINMTNKARAAARSLAVAYDAFNTARKCNDDNAIRVWGNMLIDAQRATGVELYEEANIRVHINFATA